MNHKQRIVVIGAGFGGLSFCKKIDKSKYEVTILDRNNYHSFPPLFYQVASGGLEPASISFPLRREFRGKHMKDCRFNYGEVHSIDTAAKEIVTEYETIPYDILVIAAGTTNNFFGIKDLQQRVCTLKSTSQAIRTRNEVLLRLERAAIEQDPERRRRLLTFAVIGGGPTGVDVAGALGEMKRYIIPRESHSCRRFRPIASHNDRGIIGRRTTRSRETDGRSQAQQNNAVLRCRGCDHVHRRRNIDNRHTDMDSRSHGRTV